ncbi:hypothetical protein TGPRC2_215347 [Toxoplasma gondii TgCatPRC2]|uniref:Uncharacterized protein n=13 Tax=Toxoplasma gondii TaxID=5811 RepID=A0A125YK46_TOXGV|nr:hypothetical protein TGME49_215347 [Toxoplasma gondii ME49]EPR60041.1 hypothetical protein TGGT1_215347 [Toxoplasma gondii GT1]ESS31228.1 hypothetical protein TGVEG_215347 [Toxoplasma gondii VEG]KAF4640004.1 hypothetical protein TGRH88_039290 [Toxoplasma gondii]KFG36108.1 hypothetical protein TGDOM2_215347 [Toxoplasma gondii GAB2-2007-GAL-DOM2]KFG41352.1 hypothetical protein TGP89_215347 [Toxoplasma gondii p89]KFG52844.1 hypothetical protein TGFOU_215347 [Toxoplasma gondii FOU]KFG62149.1 |eukprot:XP_018635696.1 hypothetical protein TGME49_215347 [Toxoplasma gondii ME49]
MCTAFCIMLRVQQSMRWCSTRKDFTSVGCGRQLPSNMFGAFGVKETAVPAPFTALPNYLSHPSTTAGLLYQTLLRDSCSSQVKQCLIDREPEHPLLRLYRTICPKAIGTGDTPTHAPLRSAS